MRTQCLYEVGRDLRLLAIVYRNLKLSRRNTKNEITFLPSMFHYMLNLGSMFWFSGAQQDANKHIKASYH